MQSLRELYKIGRGPSSSHTMGPERAVKSIKKLFPSADLFKVTLYGSLALTGEGHGTDRLRHQLVDRGALTTVGLALGIGAPRTAQTAATQMVHQAVAGTVLPKIKAFGKNLHSFLLSQRFSVVLSFYHLL